MMFCEPPDDGGLLVQSCPRWADDAVALSQNGHGHGEIVTPPWPSPSMGNGHCPGKYELWALRLRAMALARMGNRRSTMGFLHAIVPVPVLWSCLRRVAGKKEQKDSDGFHLMGSVIGHHVLDGRSVLRSCTQKRKRDPKQHTMGCGALHK